MDQTAPGSSAVFRRSRMPRFLTSLLVMAVMAAGCGGSPTAPTFALAIQNGSDLTIRVNVVVAAGQKPSRSLAIPAGSGVLETAEATMGWTGTEAIPVTVELYTETCAPIETFTVGRGATLIHVRADRSVEVSETTLSAGSAVLAPELKPPC